MGKKQNRPVSIIPKAGQPVKQNKRTPTNKGHPTAKGAIKRPSAQAVHPLAAACKNLQRRRDAARQAKDWAAADALRSELMVGCLLLAFYFLGRVCFAA